MMFSVGDRVRIRKTAYKILHKGDIGTVRSAFTPYGCKTAIRIAVDIDGVYNARSGLGCFYFEPNELEKLQEQKGDSKMGNNIAIEGNYRIAVVTNLAMPDKSYVCACFDEGMKQGDKCIVIDQIKHYILGEVSMFMDEYSQAITHEIVCSVDFTAYETRKDLREKRAKLMKQMADRAASLQQIAIYKMLAEQDPEMGDFMNEFMALEKALKN